MIGALAGEAAQILREAGGVVVPPGDTPALAGAIAALAGDPARRAELAARGRAYVERFFDRAELAREYRKILDAAGQPAMRLLVTGGSGFLGSWVLREAARRGHELTALVRSRSAAARVHALGAHPVTGDLDRATTLADAFDAGRCEALLNLASLGFGHAPAIVAATEAARIPRAVFVSTTAVTTTLPGSLRRVRLAAEQRIRDSSLDWTILRPTMIYGAAGDRNLSRLLPLLRRAPVLPVPGGGHLQQPVFVADVADAVLAAAERADCARATYDVAGPLPLTFAELLRTAGKAVASRTRFVPVPLPPVVAAARGYELISRHPRIKVEQIRRLGEDKAFSIEPAARDLGYAPRPFAEGIRAEARALGMAA